MKVVMTGGGTGGHIYPAIAIADRIREERPDCGVVFVGTEKGLEKTLVPQWGYPIRFITATGLDRRRLHRNVKALADFAAGLREAKALMKELRPDMVIGTGGYVTGPVIKAAADLGIRVFIHEQNVSPGLTNRLLERYAEKVFVGFAEAEKGFRNKGKITVSGNPVRKVFYGLDRKAAREGLGISQGSFVVLSFGGSRGAVRINEVMAEAAAALSGVHGMELFFVTGRGHFDRIAAGFAEKGIALDGNVRVLPYADEMHRYLAACDLVVSRAGALTVSEIMVCGKPSILIPSPNVTGNHQHFNAKALADRGLATLIEERDLSLDSLMSAVHRMKADESYSAGMAMLGENRAAEIICGNLGLP